MSQHGIYRLNKNNIETKVKLDYEKFVKEFIRQMPGRLVEISLKNFTDEILAFVKRNRAAKTYEGVTLVCKKLLTYFSPIRKIDAIGIKDAEGFLDSLKQNAPKGVYNYHRTLRSMFNKANEWNYLRENPFSMIKLTKRQYQKPNFVTEIMLIRIIKYITTNIVRDVVITAFYTGCRLGELVNLTWQDINIKDEVITIGNNNYQTKSRKNRIVPIHQKVKKILIKRFPKIIRKDKHYVFSKYNGCAYTGDYFSRRFKKACRNAGIDEGIHFHCLRHGAITRMILNGAPLPAVQRIAGHSSIQTTMIYTHPDINDLRAAVNRL